MKTIIVDQPLATLIAYGAERDLPNEFSSLIAYVDYLGNRVEMLLIASSNNKPDFDTLPQEIKEEYLHYKDIKNLPEYETLPINKFIGIAKIEKGNIMDVMTLPTPQKLPSSVKPHNTFFEFEPSSNQVIFQALTEFEMKKKNEEEEIRVELQRRIEEKKKLEKELLNKEKEIEQLKEATQLNETTSSLQEKEPIPLNINENNQTKSDINIGAIIGVIIAIAVIVFLIVIGGGNIILSIGMICFLFVTILGYFRK